MDCRDEIEMWAKKWDAAQEKWAKDAPTQPQQAQKQSSFFGLQSNPIPETGVFPDQDGTDWRSIYDRSADIRPEGPAPEDDQMFQEQAKGWRRLINESQGSRQQRPAANPVQQPQAGQKKTSFQEQAEGWRNLLTPPGKDVKFFQHPQHPNSVGMDQGRSPYEPTRVAPNFTDGDELRELGSLKVKLEKLESTLLSHEIKAGKANVPASDYKSQLDKLRQQIDALSDRLTPEPGSDVY